MNSPLITSPQNERIKAAAKLRDRKGRKRQGRMLIDGLKEILLAIASGVQVIEIYILATQEGQIPSWANHFDRPSQCVIPITTQVMAKLAYGERNEVVVAVAIPPACDMTSLSERLTRDERTDRSPLYVVVEGIEKPGNLGAIVRTADATGVSAVIVADGGTDLFNPNAIRASRGAIFTVPVAAVTSSQCLVWLREQNCQMFAARLDAEQDYTTFNFTQPTALILGSEADGLTSEWHHSDVVPVRLPMLGQVDSLNLSVTTAVLCYEALRQRADSGQRPARARQAGDQ